MTSIYITDHTENVYNLIRDEPPEPPKQPRHVSKFRKQVRKEIKKKRSPHSTMGTATVPLYPPSEFLKKGCGPKFKKHGCPRLDHAPRPLVPDRKSQLPKVVKEPQDFITKNALNVIRKPARRPVPFYVDNPRGDKFLMEPSGMARKYVYKKDYGGIPTYLQKFNKEKAIQKEEDRKAQKEDEERMQRRFYQITPDEQEGVIKGLKTNWASLYRQFLGMSVLIDNLPKKMHKLKLEKEMLQLEKDIKLLEHHQPVYVVHPKRGEDLAQRVSRAIPPPSKR